MSDRSQEELQQEIQHLEALLELLKTGLAGLSVGYLAQRVNKVLDENRLMRRNVEKLLEENKVLRERIDSVVDRASKKFGELTERIEALEGENVRTESEG